MHGRVSRVIVYIFWTRGSHVCLQVRCSTALLLILPVAPAGAVTVTAEGKVEWQATTAAVG